jgi:hypothetical protein
MLSSGDIPYITSRIQHDIPENRTCLLRPLPWVAYDVSQVTNSGDVGPDSHIAIFRRDRTMTICHMDVAVGVTIWPRLLAWRKCPRPVCPPTIHKAVHLATFKETFPGTWLVDIVAAAGFIRRWKKVRRRKLYRREEEENRRNSHFGFPEKTTTYFDFGSEKPDCWPELYPILYLELTSCATLSVDRVRHGSQVLLFIIGNSERSNKPLPSKNFRNLKKESYSKYYQFNSIGYGVGGECW